MSKKSLPSLVLLFCFLSLTMACGAQTLKDTLKKIDALFTTMNKETPGAAVRISRGDKVLYARGFGMSDLEHQIPVSEETIFEAGSVSKQFTATAILLLVRDKTLSLDDEIRKYIPEFPAYQHPIKIRHLLNHTSGVRDWGEVASLGGWPRGTRVYNNNMALNYIIRQEGLNNIPGDEYLYSNSNYTLLTIIAERVSGLSLPNFTSEYIFKPLGMKNTSWRHNFKEVVARRAIGYDRHDSTFRSNMPFENTYGHAALLTTVEDLDIWNRSWKASPLGGTELLKLRTEQGRLNNGQVISYAAGVMVGAHHGFKEISHSGATAGYRCWMAYYPAADLSIVYLSNAAYFPVVETGRRMADVFLGDRAAPAQTKPSDKQDSFVANPEIWAQLSGHYYSAECDGHYTITVEKDTVWLYDQVWMRKPLRPIGPYKFENNGIIYDFRINDSSKQIFVTSTRARNVRFTYKESL